jgi:PGM1 C-terminal domain
MSDPPESERGLDDEAKAYERLKPRLAALWKEVFPRDDQAYTSVIVPSVTVDAPALARHQEALYYEEALLFLLIRLRNPRSRVIYVTSRPLPQSVLDYYLQFLAGIPVSHAAARLTLLSAYDGSARPLTEKILERPRLIEKIKSRIPNPDRAYLTVFRSTPLERRLALRLGIPLNAADPEMEGLLGKSGARKVLREAGIEVPPGSEDLRDELDLIEALSELRSRKPGVRRALVKLDHSHWDEGDAIFVFPQSHSREGLRESLRGMALPVAGEGVDSFLARFALGRGVVEELEEDVIAVASGQVRINPRGQTSLTSTHDEVRGGPNGLASEGCRFPAADAYRTEVQEQTLAVGRVLAAKGLVSRLSVQFMVLPGGTPGGFRLAASEFNLGVGGTTHPLLAVRFLSEGALDSRTGLFTTPTGRSKFYRATDHLRSDAYRGLGPEDLIDIATMNGLNYSHHTESGTLFYMMGALSEHGRVGMVAIGNSRDEAEAVFRGATNTLDRETMRGGVGG